MEAVKIWEEDVIIPTYPVGEPDKNPMFLEKRVYQGSSGKVYPHSVIDKIYDEKEDKTYRAVFLENEYLKIMVLPELGGRIQRMLDKTNNYDFVYYNHVIKPALVGLAGPWVSGGIEFNWPQHHRPSTFDPVDYTLQENEDGSATVWVSEIENMFRTKGMAGFTLYPDKAYLEISAQLYNRTNVPQTFLWWANPAIPVNDYTQSIFPPDVRAVMDHGKRDVSKFPIATGTYYKIDYSAGVDISRYKNIPVPTSYMAYHSDYDFIGGYDYKEKAGVLHVADHHISPGKKQWTWGSGEFGKAWDRNLTDTDGPYVELMTGCFTDNQPDFSWLAPYEEKTFTQYFMPYKGVGMIKNATIDAAVSLEDICGKVIVKAYTTAKQPDARITVQSGDTVYWEEVCNLSPEASYEAEFELAQKIPVEDLTVRVADKDGNELVSYQTKKEEIEEMPEAAKALPLPKDVGTTEELYLCGIHLEQYRHATREPADYYEEGLRRDHTDIRLNNAYGSLLMRRGLFAQSEPYFQAAIKKMTRSNPNPYDGEPLYNLGLCQIYQGKRSEAYDSFYKATWNGAWQDGAFYHLACIDCMNGDYRTALDHIERSIVRNYHNTKARNLKTAILRKLGRQEQAQAFAEETLGIDILDFNSRNELIFMGKGGKEELQRLLRDNHNTYLELAIDYMEAGLLEEAGAVLDLYLEQDIEKKYPLIFYYKAYCMGQLGKEKQALDFIGQAEHACSDYCFPHRLEDIKVLEYAVSKQESCAKANYYLGNLWYDKKQYDTAIACWETSRNIDESFPTVHRNLGLAYFNKRGNPKKARKSLERAVALDPTDSRVFMELDKLNKKNCMNPRERMKNYEKHLELIEDRDELYLEYVTLNNYLGRTEKAKELIENHMFHPWEGGEGKVPTQYIRSLTELAKSAYRSRQYEKAINYLWTAAGEYPYNFGEGKLEGVQENQIYYLLGRCYDAMEQTNQAEECYQKASTGLSEPAGRQYYNDQPPESIFYQGLSLLKLGREDEAYSKFNKLIDYGEKHVFDEVQIDYFAVSLPNLLIFDEDLQKKNKIHCYFMIGLGLLGKGEQEKADEIFDRMRSLEKYHPGLRFHVDKRI